MPTLLFLAANPSDTARLGVADECRAIDQALLRARYRECFNLIPHGAVRVEDFPELLLRHRPHLLHFSGHGGPSNQIALENQDGFTHPVPLELLRAWFAVLKDDLRCVVLNACDSEEQARAIAEYVDVVIGMSRAISDTGAIAFSAAFYHAIACGRSLQDAFNLGRAALQAQDPAEQDVPRLIAPRADPAQIVLVPAPEAASRPVAPDPGQPSTPLPPLDLTILPTLPAAFQGRQAELAALEAHLTGPDRPHILTLYGAPGQGKTTLARLAAQRFASSWPGGVLAISLENLPTRLDLLATLIDFLRLDLANLPPAQAETRLLQHLERRPPLLLILDNAETLAERLAARDSTAADLAELLFERLPRPVTLFLTSRRRLARPGEQSLELPGLSPAEGAALFRESAPDCRPELERDPAALETLSRTVEGHPLSLRLLALAYNNLGGPLPTFLQQLERHLAAAENTYTRLDHRQRTLAACIQTSIDPLPQELKDLLPQLTLFHAPFQPTSAVAILDPDSAANPATSPLPARLRQLWQRGLLDRQTAPLELYHLLPPIRLHAAQTAPEPAAPTLQRFAQTYADLIRWIFDERDKGPTAPTLARLLAPDLDRTLPLCSDESRAWANCELGYVEHRLGSPWKGRDRIQQALSWAREHDRKLTIQALNVLALICDDTGRSWESLTYLKEALEISRKIQDQIEEGITLTNIGDVYLEIKPQESLRYYQEALSIYNGLSYQVGEASILNGIGWVYMRLGQWEVALENYQKALLVFKKMGNQIETAHTLCNIGEIYIKIERSDEALQLFQEAQLLFRNLGDLIREAASFSGMGLAYRKIDQQQNALECYQAALALRQETGDRNGESTSLSNIAWWYVGQGNDPQAINMFWQVLKIRQETGYILGEVTTLYLLAFLLERNGQINQAIPLLNRSITLMITNNLIRDTADHTLDDHKALLSKCKVQLPPP